MKPLIAATVGMIVLLCAGAGVSAQGRGDAGDRSQRGDSEEFRDTIRQERLKKPATPLWGQATPEPNVDGTPKPKNKKK
jgi:hypothetical protein